MSDCRQVWTVQLVRRYESPDTYGLGIFAIEDEAIACAVRSRAAWHRDLWDVRLEGPRDWEPGGPS
jgi:hypothetical protein